MKSIDRLGRDYEEIMNQWRIITKELQVYVVVLDIPLLDTRQKDRDLYPFQADFTASQREIFSQGKEPEGDVAGSYVGWRVTQPWVKRSAGLP